MRGGGEDKKEIVYEEGSSNKDGGERVVKPFFNWGKGDRQFI